MAGNGSNDNNLAIKNSLKSINIGDRIEFATKPLVGSTRNFMFKDSVELSSKYAIDITRGFDAGEVVPYTGGVVGGSDFMLPQSGDASPLYIRAAFFHEMTITQSSPYPCDANNIITVSLVSSVPLRTMYEHCNPTITIQGLDNYVTPDDMNINVMETQMWTGSASRPNQAGVQNIFGGVGEWRRTQGSLMLNVSEGQVMEAGGVYEFAFRLHNPTEAQTAPQTSLTVRSDPYWIDAYQLQTFSDYYTSQQVTSTFTLSDYEAYNIIEYELRPVRVRDIQFALKTVNQSKPFPCALDNTITVGLALNVPLLMTCKHPVAANVYNHTPSVTVKGLDNSESRTSSLFVTMDGGAGAFFDPFASWNRNLALSL